LVLGANVGRIWINYKFFINFFEFSLKKSEKQAIFKHMVGNSDKSDTFARQKSFKLLCGKKFGVSE